MRNILVIAQREFRQRARSRGFLISSIAWPVFFLFMFAISGFFSPGAPQPETPVAEEPVSPAIVDAPTGYVDQSGLIEAAPSPAADANLIAFPDTAAANQALQAGEIEAYYHISSDYIQTGEIRRVSMELPSGPVSNVPVTPLLAAGLVEQSGVDEQERFRTPLGPTGPQFVSLAEEAPAVPGMINFAPFLVTIFIILPLFTSGDQLVRSVTQEKSSRVMEILLLSLQPKQLLAGKLLGFGALTFMQYAIWILIAVIAMIVTGQDLSVLLAQINLSAAEIVYVAIYALGGYILYSALMAGLGALAPNLRSANSLTFILILPMVVPFFFWTAIVGAPHSTLAIVLSLFPFSAPLGMLLRLTTTTVPFWQIAISLALLGLTSIGIIWLMARLFRVQTLLSGEAISLRRVWSVLTTA